MNEVVNRHAWKRFTECDRRGRLKRRQYWLNVAMRTSPQTPAWLKKQAS
jgi:hypothetical protein